MTSISEDTLLSELGIAKAECKQIQGVALSSSSVVRDGLVLSEEQLSALAIVRLAYDPPPEVGHMQLRTTNGLLRPLYLRWDSNCNLFFGMRKE